MQFRGNSCFDSRIIAQVAGHLRLRFDSRSVHVNFLVDAVALGQFFLSGPFRFPISLSLYQCSKISHLHINTIVIRRTSGRSLGNFTNTVPSRGRRSSEQKNTATLHCFRQLCRRFDIGAGVP